MKHTQQFLVLLFCIMTFHAFAQDTTIYNIGYSGSGSINKTESSRMYLVNNGLKFGIKRSNIVLNTAATHIYGQQLERITNNDFNANADFNLLKSRRKFYYWGLVNYDKSASLRIDNRVQAGLGVGYTLLNNNTLSVVLSDGPLYETTYLTDTSYNTLRNSFRLKYKINAGKYVIIEGTNFLQNSVFDVDDYIIKAVNGLAFRINPWLNITASSVYNKLNLNGRENLLITFGLRTERVF